MVSIQETEKNGRVFRGIRLNHLGVGESIEITLLYDKPRLVSTKFGQVQSFAFKYNGMEVSTMIPASFKGEGFGTSLGEKLATFKRGDVLLLTKKSGQLKNPAPNGRKEFTFYSVEKKGFDDRALNPSPQPIPQVSVPKINVSLPSVRGSEKKTALVLTELERAVVDAIKTQHPEYNREQVKAVIVANNIAQDRATQIVSGYF